MDKEIVFRNCIIVVIDQGTVLLLFYPKIKGNNILDWMDSRFISDCWSSGNDSFPKVPGVYKCDILIDYHQGYYEGYPCDSESDWDFIAENVKKLNLKEGRVVQGLERTPYKRLMEGSNPPLATKITRDIRLETL